MHVTLYTVIGDFSRIKPALVHQFSEVAKEVGESENEDGVESFHIKLQDDSMLQLSVQSNAGELAKQTAGMANFFVQSPCENKELLNSVLNQIKVFNCIVGCSFELTEDDERNHFIVDSMFRAAKEINGIVLMPDMSLFTAEGKLLLSMEGESEFDNYIPIANADILDGENEENENDDARRQRSIAILREEGIPFFAQLPVIMPEAKAILRSPEEIARRLFAMFGICDYCCVVLTRGGSREETHKFLDKVDEIFGGGLEASLTPEEKNFLANDNPEEHELAKFGWRYECCYVLFWALGFEEELAYPGRICDVSGMAQILWSQKSLETLLDAAKPRDLNEVLDSGDLIYRCDWACVDARVHGKDAPAELNEEVVHEWHYAFNWLVGANDHADWDDIQPHT